MHIPGTIGIAIVAIFGLAFNGLAIFVLAYFGARLAIRHERKASQG